MNWLSKEQKLGVRGEEWVMAQLVSRGYHGEYYNDFFEEQRDIKINGCLPCEVKTSRQSICHRKTSSGNVKQYPSWRWNVSPVTSKDSVLILLAIDNRGLHHPFIMPSNVMAHRCYVQLTKHPLKCKTYYDKYLNYWQTIDYLLNRLYEDSGCINIFEAFGMEVTA